MVGTGTLRKDVIRASLAEARERTLWLLSHVPEEFLNRRVHNFYSPIGWHFGHIARTEEFWIIREALGGEVIDPHYTFLFGDLPENPKDNRVNLPPREEIIGYLAEVRRRVLDLLEESDLDSGNPFLADGYAWDFALQHECQHQETIAEMMQLIQQRRPGTPPKDWPEWKGSPATDWIAIPSGSFAMGSNDRHGYDNEKREHQVQVQGFELAKTPVTSYQWSLFIADAGYQRRELWTDEGWAWRETEGAAMPEYWTELDGGLAYFGPHGMRAIHPDEPVSCISAHEADAYARWADGRLPTEAEWEFAARGPSSQVFPWGSSLATSNEACHGLTNWGPCPVGARSGGASPFGLLDMAGNVWEWTSSAFVPYPGFQAFPYDGYSKDHMDGLHRVCRGGSWATAAPILRCSFRNWYVPTYRQGFLGLRLAR